MNVLLGRTNASKLLLLEVFNITIFFINKYFTNILDILYLYNYISLIGLINNWKRPIYYGYDQKMTKELLFQIIKELHNVGFNVISIVSDMGSTNMRLWKSLNIYINNTSFEHPIQKNQIYVFADVPHLLKLARNHLLDKYVVHF